MLKKQHENIQNAQKSKNNSKNELKTNKRRNKITYITNSEPFNKMIYYL